MPTSNPRILFLIYSYIILTLLPRTEPSSQSILVIKSDYNIITRYHISKPGVLRRRLYNKSRATNQSNLPYFQSLLPTFGNLVLGILLISRYIQTSPFVAYL